MPIEFSFTPENEPEPSELFLIEPYNGLLLPDFSEGEPKTLAIGCRKEDDYGFVDLFPGNVPAIIDSGGEPKPKYARFKVDEDHPFIDVIEDINGARGQLILRHVSSKAITSTLLIPQGLMHHN